ncbi:putative sugar phosphate isomerase [Galbibacter orientalis DSM 19592]|uniref:Putative sugar phosphate isomerase n=1 Tax=Galbibacter orientalis DSM 19592 TaxID=926559 RepID=I3C7I3_9FLAO|nr:N-acetylmuramic acid 6-phosphate etherase [Galbibacter orientalis]EIJ39576.1 putative sugar phosphate isomerase [Galbibacter orientalis DSM 19592]
MSQQLITENTSEYNNLEKMSTQKLLININTEDKTVPNAIEKALPEIEKLVNAVYKKMKKGGRLFYLGAGTSGRLGVLDASELPPTYGVSKELVIALIAGGDMALRNAVENEEDNTEKAWIEMQEHLISDKDAVIGIAASGTTPYVIGGVQKANENNITTGCITCNMNTPLAANVTYPVEVILGPEFVTGSTRMKAGTAQKLILNMISTALMIKMGKVKDNKMINMQLSNKKLVKRGIKMLMEDLKIDEKKAKALLMEHQSVKKAIANFKG